MTIYTHVPLHDINSIQRDEHFIRTRASVSHTGGKLNEREEIRYSSASSATAMLSGSFVNHELQSGELSS